MTTQATTSDPSFLKRVESLLALALSGSSVARTILTALRNVDFIDTVVLDDKGGPTANYILGAANVTRKGSGIFLFMASYTGTDSAADVVSLVAARIPGPTTVFSGGTVSGFGGTIRAAEGGTVTATGTGATTNVAADSYTLTAGGVVSGTVAAFVSFPGPVGQTNLILFQLNATHNMTLQQINSIGYVELP